MQIKTLVYNTSPSYRDTGLAIVRIFLGVFMIYHGWEVFDTNKMNEYTKWMVDLRMYAPVFLAYLGKSIELITGIFIMLGLFTRIAVIPLALTMLFICFAIGKGRIFMEEQHPFLFVLLCLLYFFTGSGKWSLDNLLFNTQKATIE